MKRVLEQERDEIGAINQLAAQQYESQKEGYKHLSVRIGELEREKLAILDFMNELERKKLDTFMSAYNKVNETFQSIFREMTGEGNGRMVLDNPENPFEGGLDVLLQFREKPSSRSGARAGERNPSQPSATSSHSNKSIQCHSTSWMRSTRTWTCSTRNGWRLF